MNDEGYEQWRRQVDTLLSARFSGVTVNDLPDPVIKMIRQMYEHGVMPDEAAGEIEEMEIDQW